MIHDEGSHYVIESLQEKRAQNSELSGQQHGKFQPVADPVKGYVSFTFIAQSSHPMISYKGLDYPIESGNDGKKVVGRGMFF